MNANIKLWGVSLSPYVRKVMVALAEKQISYELKETLPTVLLKATKQSVPVEFERVSPLGKIPALQVGGDYMISDSSVIAEYLDLEFSSGNSLYPRNPKLYAKARWFEMYSDTVLTSVAYQKIFLEKVVKPHVLKEEPNKEVINCALYEELPGLLQFLNDSLQDRVWLVGENFSMADVAVVTQLLALSMAGYTLSESQYPDLKRHFQMAMKRESLKKFFV